MCSRHRVARPPQATYCSAECQKTGWTARHKRACRIIAAEAGTACDIMGARPPEGTKERARFDYAALKQYVRSAGGVSSTRFLHARYAHDLDRQSGARPGHVSCLFDGSVSSMDAEKMLENLRSMQAAMRNSKKMAQMMTRAGELKDRQLAAGKAERKQRRRADRLRTTNTSTFLPAFHPES